MVNLTLSNYVAYSNKEVNTAWSMISDQAKVRDDPLVTDAERFEKYQARIYTYSSVTTQNARALSQNPTVVEVVITYYYHDRSPQSFLATFTLVPNESTGWLIDSVSP